MIPDGRLRDFLAYVRRRVLGVRSFPPVGKADLGSLDRVSPISDNWGFDRGKPVDRLYIESFLEMHSDDIRGSVLEVADNVYTQRFGADRVVESGILHNTSGNSKATIVADLAVTESVPESRFDCIICTQTLHLIFDLSSAINSLFKMLRPGGVLLLTAPAITAISRWDLEHHGDHWRFTSPTLRRLFETRFGAANVDVQSFGNVYAATAFLHGLAVEELDARKLKYFDPDYEILGAVRACRRTT